ncbi:MAG: hypothetical protein H5T32_02325 [Candidatus Methanosuratus sp.]|nr:hypothetical protein [Candidatus Methanosuratincola sp.]
METEKKFSRELRSLLSLTLINFAFGGIAIAIGITLAMNNILALLSGGAAINLAAAIFGSAAFALALKWLVSTAELFDGVDDIKDEYSKIKGSRDQKALAGLIARLAAHYRSNKQRVLGLVLLTRAAGICFIANGGLALLQLALDAPAGWEGTLATVAAAAVNFGVGAAGLSIPHFFRKYSFCWETRLHGIDQAEGRLSGLLGGE